MSHSLVEATETYKIFGRGARHAVDRLRQGVSRDELRDEGLTAAVIDASFKVARGEIFVVMGLSGSGKSTLIRLINGLLTPTSGEVIVDGQNIAHMSQREMRQVCQTKVSMVFQHFALFPHRTVGENAAYGLEVRGINRPERTKAASEALEMVGLDGWEQSLPGELSGGMRQRVGLARALAAGTEILLMDEAFSALDPLIRREMQDQLIDLQERLGRTILFITHDLNEAMRMGDRIAMMRDGRIVQIGTAEQILNDPATDYVAQFVQDVDRSRILTAANVMERPAAVLGSAQGPLAAHRLLRENQLQSIFVVDRNHRLIGTLTDGEVAEAVEHRDENLDRCIDRNPISVAPATALVDLLADSAEATVPLAVVDDDRRLLGVIPKVTLLNALSLNSVSTGEVPTVGPTGATPADGSDGASVAAAQDAPDEALVVAPQPNADESTADESGGSL